MIDISSENKHLCCGCGGCKDICPTSCIAMEKDREGFSYPAVDKAKCINCGLCERVCPVTKYYTNKQQQEFERPLTVGGWIRDEAIRQKSSSGGIFSLVAQYIIDLGGTVWGAAMDCDMKVRHRRATTSNALDALRGSKYVQSDTNEAYKGVREDLNAGRQVLFTGTPCQCAGLKTFLQKDYENLLTVDFICHGVPSPGVFESYIAHLEKMLEDRVISFRFRLKDRNWNPTGLQLGTGTGTGTATGKYIRHYPGFMDCYMNGFLSDIYLRPSCYDCAFKTMPKDYADITIADFWGVTGIDRELHDGKGTSLMLVNTQRGRTVFGELKKEMFYKECDFDRAITRNKSLVRSAVPHRKREAFFEDYGRLEFGKLMFRYMNPFVWAVNRAGGMARVITGRLLSVACKKIGISYEEKYVDSLIQFVKFAIVGVSNVFVSLAINYTVLVLLKPAEIRSDYVIANSVAFVLSVLWSYYWNSTRVFEVGKVSVGERLRIIFKTYVSYAFTGLILNNVLSTIWIRGLGISKYIAPLLNLPFSVPINFVLNKFWAYKKS